MDCPAGTNSKKTKTPSLARGLLVVHVPWRKPFGESTASLFYLLGSCLLCLGNSHAACQLIADSHAGRMYLLSTMASLYSPSTPTCPAEEAEDAPFIRAARQKRHDLALLQQTQVTESEMCRIIRSSPG